MRSAQLIGSWSRVASLLAIFTFPLHAGGHPSRAVAEAGFVPIGGIEQWISVRGDDRSNPVLLVVHGGPGEAQGIFATRYRPWEKSFVVAQWDQRGAGHTYAKYGEQTPEVGLERITRDGIEVAEHLCRSLGKKKIVVLGHSWGSIVAVQMVQRRPDLFAAYVGTGQVASWKAMVQSQFDLLLAKARADGDRPTIQKLEGIGRPDPKDAKQFFDFNKGLLAAMAPADQAWLKGLRASTPASLGVDPKELQDLGAGMQLTGQRVLPDQIATDLPATAVDLHTAFFVLQGKDDVMTPTAAAVAYFHAVKAPKKELVLLAGAGHFAYLTSPEAFLAALVHKVRPVAIARGA